MKMEYFLDNELRNNEVGIATLYRLGEDVHLALASTEEVSDIFNGYHGGGRIGASLTNFAVDYPEKVRPWTERFGTLKEPERIRYLEARANLESSLSFPESSEILGASAFRTYTYQERVRSDGPLYDREKMLLEGHLPDTPPVNLGVVSLCLKSIPFKERNFRPELKTINPPRKVGTICYGPGLGDVDVFDTDIAFDVHLPVNTEMPHVYLSPEIRNLYGAFQEEGREIEGINTLLRGESLYLSLRRANGTYINNGCWACGNSGEYYNRVDVLKDLGSIFFKNRDVIFLDEHEGEEVMLSCGPEVKTNLSELARSFGALEVRTGYHLLKDDFRARALKDKKE